LARPGKGPLEWSQPIEVVDAQLHLNQVGPDWSTAEPVAVVRAAVAAMDAVGIDACVIDEVVGFDERGRILPGHDLPNGARRSESPVSELAMSMFPERFRYVTRVDRLDPELEGLLAGFRTAQGRSAIRVASPPESGETAAFASGGFGELFELVQHYDLPIFVHPILGLDSLPEYLVAFPRLRVVIDQCGVMFPGPGESPVDRYSRLERTIALAEYDNVMLKWSNVQRLSVSGFPFEDVMPYLRRIVDGYGAGRVMWAGDFTQALDTNREGYNQCSWSESLTAILLAEAFSAHEKAWLLGGTIRTLLDWPSPGPPLPSTPG
jgi:hypothetical protein